jgi:hypothetical protein
VGAKRIQLRYEGELASQRVMPLLEPGAGVVEFGEVTGDCQSEGDTPMKLTTLFTVYAVVSAIFGLAFVFAPVASVAPYGITLSPAGIPTARLFGASLFEFALLAWFVRKSGDSEARKAIILALFVGEAIGFVVALLTQLSGVANALGWSTVAIYLSFAVGFGYFQFIKPSTA